MTTGKSVGSIPFDFVALNSYKKSSIASESDIDNCFLLQESIIQSPNNRSRCRNESDASFRCHGNASELKLISPTKNQVELSPWLSRYFTQRYLYRNSSDDLFGNEWKHQHRYGRLEEVTKQLEFKLIERYFFSVKDATIILEAINSSIESTSSSLSSINFETRDIHHTGMALGMIDFLTLVLDTVVLDVYDNIPDNVGQIKEILVASIVHFVECATAQKENVLGIVRNALFQERSNLYTTTPSSLGALSSTFTTHARESHSAFNPAMSITSHDSLAQFIDLNTSCDFIEVEEIKMAQSVILVSPQAEERNNYALPQSLLFDSTCRSSESEILSIARCAGRIKRAEIVIKAINLSKVSSLSSEEASRIRALLLAIGENWLSLALRCVACLFRMKGILETMPKGVHEHQTLAAIKTSETIRTTREGLAVSAILAEQLGLNRLKTRLEDIAFQVLYRRQYRAAMARYGALGSEQDVLQRETTVLQSQIEKLLTQDSTLMSQLSSLLVTNRVKKPYSLWRKLLKDKKKSRRQRSSSTSLSSTKTSTTLSDAHDLIGLRIVIRAHSPIHIQSDERSIQRDELLCYYVQSLLLQHWPILDPSRMKDYIRNPKPNGYKSLHFTALHVNEKIGFEFPFEVQIRSEEMHKVAEFGRASHWGYKLERGKSQIMPSSNLDECIDVESITSNPHLQSNLLPSSSSFPCVDTTGLYDRAYPYVHALKEFRQVVKQMVYVFVAVVDSDKLTRSGTLLCLPMKARVHDVLIAMNIISTQDSDASIFMFLNGRLATLADLVCTGDIISIQSCRTERSLPEP